MKIWLRNLFGKYNFLWILYLLYFGYSQIYIIAENILTRTTPLPLIISDLIVAPLYIISIFAYTFRKKLFSESIWKAILFIIFLDLPLTLWRMLQPWGLEDYGIDCKVVGDACYFMAPFMFLYAVAFVSPVFYALFKLAFPKKAFPINFVLYPQLSIGHITNPNRFWAIPLVGYLLKLFILIPFFIFQFIIGLVAFVAVIINYFYILFKGKVWLPALDVTMWSISLNIKGFAYLSGLTNKYPSFTDVMTDPLLALHFTPGEKSSRILGIPLFGFMLRYIILLPLMTFVGIIIYAAFLGMMIGCFVVLFTGKYPAVVRELLTDTMRMQSSMHLYLAAMSDKYPSFSMSLNHPIKKALLILAILILGGLSTLISKNFATMSTQQIMPSGDLKQVYKTAFMQNCNSSDQLTSYCECTYIYLTERYTTEELINMESENTGSGQPSAVMMEATNACSSHIPQELLQDSTEIEVKQ